MFLNSPRKKLFICGSPGVGKTTFIYNLYNFLKNSLPAFHFCGFITKEIKEHGKRKGFVISLLNDSQEVLLAMRKELLNDSQIKSQTFVGKYYVFTENLEKTLDFLEEEWKKSIENKVPPFFIIDEIGKMEVLSSKFCDFIERVLNSPAHLIATLGYGDLSFLKKVHNFSQAVFCEVTKENRSFLFEKFKLDFVREGKLVVIEGIDGAGKTTFACALTSLLKRFNINVRFSAEPTSGPYGQKLKELLKKEKVKRKEIKELFLKDRKWHVENIILPALKNGEFVILDRYYLSTVAYQGAQGFSIKELLKENETIAPLPDLVIFLNILPEIAIQRIKNREKEKTCFEKLDFLKKVAEIYEIILPNFKFLKLDATSSVEKNVDFTWEYLKSKFKSALSQNIMKV